MTRSVRTSRPRSLRGFAKSRSRTRLIARRSSRRVFLFEGREDFFARPVGWSRRAKGAWAASWRRQALCLSKIKSEHIRGAVRRGLGGKEYALPSSRYAIGARPYPRPSACASHYSSERKISESGADVPRPKTMTWSKHSRRTDPISRSAKQFSQGEAGAIGLSRMPMARSRRVTTAP